MSKNTAIQELRTLQKEVEEKKKTLKPLFNAGLKEVFEANPKTESLEMNLNNHEFNDGDTTHFSLYYDEPTVRFADGVVMSEYGDPEGEPTAEHKTARDAFVSFFKEFDVEGFYEGLYGDAHESIMFTFSGGKVKTS